MKKIKKLLIAIGLILSYQLSAQIKVGETGVPVSSAMLEMKSTTKGLLLPRVTSKTLITNPVEGLMVYTTSDNKLNVYRNGSWTVIDLVNTSTASSTPSTPNLGPYLKVGNNPNTISPNAIVEVETSNKGLLIPRLDNAQMNAIASPSQGLIIFNTEVDNICIHNGTAWNCLVGCASTANAGIDITNGAGYVELAANVPLSGYGTWSIVSGGTGVFSNLNSATSYFYPTSGTDFVLRWTISNLPCTPSSDEVSITAAPCSPLTTIVHSSGSTNQTVCLNSSISSIVYLTTSASDFQSYGLPNGVSANFNYTLQKITITGSPTEVGTYNYTITAAGCQTSSLSGTIIVTPDNTIEHNAVGGGETQTICKGSSLSSILYTTTGATGATFSGLPSGVNGTWANNSIEISGSPNEAGSFNYTISLTGGCGTITKQGNITVQESNSISLTSAGATETQELCVNLPIDNITYTTLGATQVDVVGLPNGVLSNWNSNSGELTISGSPTNVSTNNYSIYLNNSSCPEISRIGEINVKPDATIALDGTSSPKDQTIFINEGIPLIKFNITNATDATVSGLPTGLTANIDIPNGAIIISGSPNDTIKTYNYTISLEGCGSVSVSGILNLTSKSIAATSISVSNQNICSGNTSLLKPVGGFLGSGAKWKWYTDACGGTLLGEGDSLEVMPTTTTTYYVRAEGDANTTNCVVGVVIVRAPITVSHAQGAFAPETLNNVGYNIVGHKDLGSKCFFAQNLGATQKPTSVTDNNANTNGWYWQFNKKQGFKNSGGTLTPSVTWTPEIIEDADWSYPNDPCVQLIGSGWRLPTYTEMFNIDEQYNWNSYNSIYNVLNFNTAGFLSHNDGTLQKESETGIYWTSTQYHSRFGYYTGTTANNASIHSSYKSYGFSVRCVKDF